MYQSRIHQKKNRSDRYQKKRELELPEEKNGTYFGVVKDMLGNGRVRVFCEDGSLKIGRIRGAMRKSRGKTIIEKNDLVVVAQRDYEDKLDIMHKYTADEFSELVRNDLLPEKIYKTLTESEFSRIEGGEDDIVFYDQPATNNPEPEPEPDLETQSEDEEEEKVKKGGAPIEDLEVDIDTI